LNWVECPEAGCCGRHEKRKHALDGTIFPWLHQDKIPRTKKSSGNDSPHWEITQKEAAVRQLIQNEWKIIRS